MTECQERCRASDEVEAKLDEPRPPEYQSGGDAQFSSHRRTPWQVNRATNATRAVGRYGLTYVSYAVATRSALSKYRRS